MDRAGRLRIRPGSFSKLFMYACPNGQAGLLQTRRQHRLHQGPPPGRAKMLSADICGGILLVITPLYLIRTILPGRNRRASGVMTITRRRVAKSSTSRRSLCTLITRACMIIFITSNLHITEYVVWRRREACPSIFAVVRQSDSTNGRYRRTRSCL